MSGLLRRIKRSRTAAAGEPPAEGQDAGTEGADTTAGTEPGADAPAPAGDESKTAELTAATVPAIAADPDRPAGLDERTAAVQPPSGRRGHLRRRLRYLRRVRELMLRDLGGLAYEVHRTGGGDFTAHSGVIGGKIERLTLLDSEAHAIEQALGAPRSETVVFEPGVGGTCDVCGELFASAAKYCSHCGTPTDPAARETPAPAEPAHEPRHVPPMPKSPGTGETAVLAPAAAHEGAPAARADETGSAEEPAAATADETGRADATGPAEEPAAARADESGPFEEPATESHEAGAAEEPATESHKAGPAEEPAAPADDTGRAGDTGPAEAPATEPHEAAAEAPADRQEERGVSNGRVEDPSRPPDLSAGDPLATREPRE